MREDHFSSAADRYARFRPVYPAALFDFLAGLCARRELAWDAATGNGQAAVELADRFQRVVATDASERQIAHATRHPAVEYRVEPSESTSIESSSVDLTTVAQALHWFDFERFWDEVRRVSRPDAIFAAWCYGFLRIAPAIDRILRELYSVTLGDKYWPAERRHIEAAYATIPFPFARIEAPVFSIRARLDLERLMGYLGTWSAVKRYREANAGSDPLVQVRKELEAVWGEPGMEREVVLDLTLLLGRVR